MREPTPRDIDLELWENGIPTKASCRLCGLPLIGEGAFTDDPVLLVPSFAAHWREVHSDLQESS